MQGVKRAKIRNENISRIKRDLETSEFAVSFAFQQSSTMSAMRGSLFSLPSSFTAKAKAMVRQALLGQHKDSIKLLKINEVEEYRDGRY